MHTTSLRRVTTRWLRVPPVAFCTYTGTQFLPSRTGPQRWLPDATYEHRLISRLTGRGLTTCRRPSTDVDGGGRDVSANGVAGDVCIAAYLAECRRLR